MALSVDDPLLWGFVFVTVFIVEVLVVFNMRRDKTSHRYERPSAEAQLAEGEDLTDILSRFVEDDTGARLGETVGMDGKLVVVKMADKLAYMAVPKDRLERVGEVFRVAPGTDLDEASQRGEEWRTRQHRVVEYQPSELPDEDRS